MEHNKTGLNFAYADKTAKHKNDNVIEDYFIKNNVTTIPVVGLSLGYLFNPHKGAEMIKKGLGQKSINQNLTELCALFPLKHNKYYFGLHKYEKKEENYTYTFCANDIPNDIVPLERIMCGLETTLDNIIEFCIFTKDNIIKFNKDDFKQEDSDVVFTKNYLYLENSISKYVFIKIISKEPIRNIIIFQKGNFLNLEYLVYPYDIQVSENKIIRFFWSKHNLIYMKLV